MSDSPLYMIRAELDRARLFELARAQRLPLRDVDLGYIIHCGLRSAFGEHAPQPFAFDDARRALTVFGYAEHSAETLLEHGKTFADPLAWSICRESGLLSKPMPARFASGTRLHFEVRICPVLRKAAQGEKHRQGAEVDVFLARCWEVGTEHAVDREAIYRQWLSARLAAQGAATLLSARMTAFRRERVVRSRHRGEGPKVRHCERPDARFHGALEVGESDAFAALLRRGIGRHRAFGFGMLLLRPPAKPC